MVTQSPHRVLLVDDDESIRSVHTRMVQTFGYEVETASDGIEALAKLAMGIDLVLLDAEMPSLDGFEVARRIRADPRYTYLPIVMVTGLAHATDRRRALEIGVNDYVTKPVDADELRLRAKWLLELKSAHDRLNERGDDLERTVQRRTEDLREALQEMTTAKRLIHEAHLDTIRRLTIAAEYRDHDTAGHIERIGRYSHAVARALGMSPGEAEIMLHAAPMHDVGKLGIPDRILLKPGPLDDEEWAIMRSHTALGARILEASTSPITQLGEKIALTHHEKWDGSGYPAGLAGTTIPLESRICAVVDYFDALTMDRPYRSALDNDTVIGMMEAEAGAHFDTTVLNAFLQVRDDIFEIQTSHH